jgi:hypothetical protein
MRGSGLGAAADIAGVVEAAGAGVAAGSPDVDDAHDARVTTPAATASERKSDGTVAMSEPDERRNGRIGEGAIIASLPGEGRRTS